MKKACVSFPNGCPRAMLGAAKLVDYFRLNGWRITTRFSEADLVLVGVCGVTEDMERSSMKFLDIADHRRRKDSTFIVFGCLPGINEPAVLARFDAITITKQNLGQLDSVINASVKYSQVKDPNDMEKDSDFIHRSYNFWDQFRSKNKFRLTSLAAYKAYAMILRRWHHQVEPVPSEDNSFYIKVAAGCSGLCSYCAIKNDCGPLHSKPLGDIRQEFENGLSQGSRIFRLVAEDVGSYGQDIGLTIVDLLQELLSHPGDYQLFIDDFSPKWLVRYYPGLLDVFKTHSEKFGYLGLEIQSGSEHILDLMRREYQAARAKDCILGLKDACPQLEVHTHVILGFPGESEADFLDTLNFLKSVHFSRVAIHPYSDRPNTLSANFRDKVAENVKMNRAYRLIRALGGTAYMTG